MLSINYSEAVLAVISFFLLYFLLKKFLYDPVIKFMDARQKKIDEGAAKIADAEARLQASKENTETRLLESRNEAQRIIADSHRQDVLTSGALHDELREMRSQAEKESEKVVSELRNKESGELQKELPELAFLLAKKLLE